MAEKIIEIKNINNSNIFQEVNEMSTSGGGNLVQTKFTIFLNKHKVFSIFILDFFMLFKFT